MGNSTSRGKKKSSRKKYKRGNTDGSKSKPQTTESQTMTITLESEDEDEAQMNFNAEVDLATTLHGHIDTLINTIDPDCGLLDALFSEDFLTYEQLQLILKQPAYSEQITQLVTFITGHTTFNTRADIFMQVLDGNQHKHVSNFIRGNGVREKDFADHWPLIHSDSGLRRIKRMDKRRRSLIDLVDTSQGLLDEMLSRGIINIRQKTCTEENVHKKDKNNKLFDIIRRGSVNTYKTFIRCLKETKQHGAFYIFEPNDADGMRPLSRNQQCGLQRSYKDSISLLHSRYSLTAEMLASDCITDRHKEFIEAAPTLTESSKRIIEIVRAGSEGDLDTFKECLMRTGHDQLANIIQRRCSSAGSISSNSSVFHSTVPEFSVQGDSVCSSVTFHSSGSVIFF